MNRRSLIILMVVLLLVGGTGGLLAHWKTHQRLGKPGLKLTGAPIFDAEGEVAGTNGVYLPDKIPGWSSAPEPITKLELGWLPKDTTYGRRVYKAPDGFQALVNVVLMGTDRTSIHKPQYCLTGQGWRIDRSEQTTIRIERPHAYDLPVMKLTAASVRETTTGEQVPMRGIYLYWFVADNALTGDHLQRMWWMARELMKSGTLQRWAYVSCFTVCLPGQEEAAYERARQLIAAAVPEFQTTCGVQVSTPEAPARARGDGIPGSRDEGR